LDPSEDSGPAEYAIKNGAIERYISNLDFRLLYTWRNIVVTVCEINADDLLQRMQMCQFDEIDGNLNSYCSYQIRGQS
jgi:hypothetical protein